MNSNSPTTYNDWTPVVRSLCRALVEAGFSLHSVDDGEERVLTPTVDKATEHVCAVDESHLFVTHPAYDKRPMLFIVLGNDPCETVADYSDRPELDACVEAWSDSWEGRKCPTVSRVR